MPCFLQSINAMRIDAQMQLSRALIEERGQRDIAIQQALAHARADMHEKISVVVTDDKTGYNVSHWTSSQDQNTLHIMAEPEESDKEKDC